MPWDFPTQTELLSQLERYKSQDANQTGYISREILVKVIHFVCDNRDNRISIKSMFFFKIPFWFQTDEYITNHGSSQLTHERQSHLINFWCDLFSMPVESLPSYVKKTEDMKYDCIDYKNMVFFNYI